MFNFKKINLNLEGKYREENWEGIIEIYYFLKFLINWYEVFGKEYFFYLVCYNFCYSYFWV